ncbi:SRPBCC family protein [Pseudochryseolinea flava]|nr:SRPBCC domain-containing protein [Pseudochryseolinea flava]
METITYKSTIDAPAKKVWDTMLNADTYKQWVSKSWPNSSYEGKWQEGTQIRFTGPGGGGTLAELVEVKPHKRVLARHIAILLDGGKEDRTSEMAKGWIGITEAYDFIEENGKTTVVVTIETNPEWKKMFDDGWPTALEELKKLSERKLQTA